MVMVLSCTAAVTVSSLTEVSVRGVGPCASSPFWPSLSSSLLVQKHGSRSRRSSLAVASYGIPSYGAPRPYQTPGADFHNGARPAGTISNPAFGDVTRSGFQWTFGAPHAYGAGVETAELGQQGATLQDVLEDVKEPELDGGDVGSGGRGDDNGGSGGGRGDGSGGGDADKPHKKPGFSMSQKLTLAYAILVGVGGIMGFAKSGSSKSLMAGGGSASILYYVFLNLPSNPVLASTIGLGISGMLLFIMGSRYMESGKVFPAGVVSLFSLVMAGGYIHGIMRSAH